MIISQKFIFHEKSSGFWPFFFHPSTNSISQQKIFSSLASQVNSSISKHRQSFKGHQSPYFFRLYMKGVGYRFWLKLKKLLVLELGYTHRYCIRLPVGVTGLTIRRYVLILYGSNLNLLSQIVSEIVALRFPDVYKSKGVRHAFERINVKSKQERKK